MSILYRLIPSTRGAWRRAFILSLYVVILVASVLTHAFQNRADTVILYAQGNVAYAKALGETQPHALFPLANECDFTWMTSADGARISHNQITATLETESGIVQDTPIGLHFPSVGDVSVIQGSPWVTIRSKLGDVRVKAACPPPAPTTHHVYVYVEGNYLFSYDTLNGDLRLLMPLREQLLWSGDEMAMFNMDRLTVRDEDRQGYAWLPENAIVLGDFETAAEMVINNLDDTQVHILYGDHELMLVSYDQ